MIDINVDDFFKDAAKTLAALYAVFPRRHAIYVEDISGPEEPDEFGMHSERHMACFGTLIWLGEEGYLRFVEPIRDEAIDQAVLTGRCFTLLTSPAPRVAVDPADDRDLPESIRQQQASHIYRISSALKSRSSSRIRAAMMELMSRMEARR